MAPPAPPTLVYLYGPPASGKLTIGGLVAGTTGFRLFHNHLTVNAVREIFPFGSPAFTEVLHRLRLDVFATAARTGTSLVFTNNSIWGGADGRARFAAFAARAARVVADEGGHTLFVSVTAPAAALEARVADEARRARGKLVDVGRLREMLADHDASPLHDDDLVVDTGASGPEEAAGRIVAALERDGPGRSDGP
jgi:hypothetical protein